MKTLIVIPAYNEELILEKNILKLFAFCQRNLKDKWQIVIADNKSVDRTATVGRSLADQYQQIDYLYVGQKGKGTAIKAGWQKYAADIYCFMDADLATDLSGLPVLISGFEEGNDLVSGSRFHPQSQVRRSLARKVISHIYRLILKVFLRLKINDAPCGFKAISNKIKKDILPQVKNEQWFFDSELVVLAEKMGYKIKEIPVIWQDLREGEDKSRVNLLSLSWTYFQQVISLRKRLKKASKLASKPASPARP